MNAIANAVNRELAIYHERRRLSRIPYRHAWRGILLSKVTNYLKNNWSYKTGLGYGPKFFDQPKVKVQIIKQINKQYKKKSFYRPSIYKSMPKKRSYRKRSTGLAKRVKKLEMGYGKELKTLDVSYALDPVTAVGVITPLSQLAQGTTSITREGLQICPRHLTYKIHVVSDAGSASAEYIRVIIFVDKQNAGSYPTAVQLLETDSYLAFPEHDSRPRFRIYRDFMIQLDSVGHSGTLRKGIIKFGKNFKIWYKGTTAAEASNGKNALFLYTTGSNNTAGLLNVKTRLRFTE